MSDGKVIDIRSRNPIFNPPLRGQLEEAISPFLKDESSKTQAINTAEQVICTAMVGVARSFASRLAAKVFEKFEGEK